MIEVAVFGRKGLLALAFSVAATCAWAAEPIRLITPDEASLPPAAGTGGQTRNLTRGPGIDAVAPPPIAINGPFRLAVRFKPRNGVPVDPASVRVTYRREPAVDLTHRIKAFVSAEGIEAPAVIVPGGRHLIEIEVTDKEGRVGRSQMTLAVEGGT